MEKLDNVEIDFNRGSLKIFDTISIGDTVLIVKNDGEFRKHPDRSIINGIEPHGTKGLSVKATPNKLQVLSLSEKLLMHGGRTPVMVPVIVLTDGRYSYWFLYNNEKYKSFIKLI